MPIEPPATTERRAFLDLCAAIKDTKRVNTSKVRTALPAEAQREETIGAAMDAIHWLVNNCLRACGVEVEESNSEATWSWVEPLRERLRRYLEAALREVLEERRLRLVGLRERLKHLEAEAAAIRVELEVGGDE